MRKRRVGRIAGITAILVGATLVLSAPPQGTPSPQRMTESPGSVAAAAHHDVSAPLSTIPDSRTPSRTEEEADPEVGLDRIIEGEDADAEQQREENYPRLRATSTAPDPAVQAARRTPSRAMPTPISSFDGMGMDFSAPSDVNIDVSPTQVVQVVNTRLAVYDKSGAVLYGPVSLNTLWSGFGGRCETTNDGDPVVAWDRLASRWVVSQFAITGANPSAGTPYLECVAVSTTGDATGTWARYSFSYDYFNDYPKLAVWPDAYYMTFNMYDGNDWHGAVVCAYDRAKMLAGQAATQICFDVDAGAGSVLVATLGGSTPPPDGADAYAASLWTNESLAVWRLSIDWGNPGASTFTRQADVAVPAFSIPCNYEWSCIPQPGTADGLDAMGGRLMNPFAYVRNGSTESLLASHSVGTSPTGVRWYELRPSGTGLSLYQRGTFAPDFTNRWMPSIAMDSSGDIAVGYNAASSTVSPSIRYAGRLPADPANALSQGEATLVAGAGAQLGTNYRWGDYSALVVDPADGCTFWQSHQYVSTTDYYNWKTKIGSFRFPSCVIAPQVTEQPESQTVDEGETATFSAAATGNPAPTMKWQVSTNGSTWSDIQGALAETYSLTAIAGDDGKEYRAVFTNGGGTATTDAATLTVRVGPSVTTQPLSQTLTAGSNATFTAAATGNPEPTVKWQVSPSGSQYWSDILGATSPTYSFATVAGDNGKRYRALFTNVVGNIATDPATLTVQVPPRVTTQPTGQTVIAGATASFTAAAAGRPTPTVRWQVAASGSSSWSNVSGATSTTYAFTATKNDNGKRYRAVFTNAASSATTRAATLTVQVPPGPVGDLKATSPSTGTLKVTWSAPSAPGTSPVASYSITVVRGSTTITRSTTNRSITVTGLASNKSFTVTVRAISGAGTGAPAVTTATTK